MGADAPPAHRPLPVNLDPFPGDAAVGIIHAPGHLPDILGALDPLDPETLRPRIVSALDRFLGGVVKLRESLAPELLLMLLGQSLVVAVELRGRLELQRDSKASR